MQKPNSLYSLKRTIVLLTVFASFVGAYEVGAQPKQKVLESVYLCDGNEIKQELRNPTCWGWQENPTKNTLVDEFPLYQSNYPKECGAGVDGLVRCYFLTGRAACKAHAKIKGIDSNLPNPFCGCGVLANPTTFSCAWCMNGEMGCNNEKFFTSLVCDGGPHDISRELIPSGAYLSYCDDVVNVVSGPYSNLTKYIACGTTYTETFKGMRFTEDQVKRIRNINRKRNNITSKEKYKSDLAGFCYAKPKGSECFQRLNNFNPSVCVEPDFITTRYSNKPNSAQVHHVIPKSDGRNLKCPCGKNSYSNAVMISKQLNKAFDNKDRKTFSCNNKTEIQWVNDLPKY